jgi:hypothetical protein
MTADELIAALRAANIRVPPSGLLRAAQLRKFLAVSDRTLQSWRAHGKPPHGLRLNGQWSYPLTEVAQFLSTEPHNTPREPVDPALSSASKAVQR